MSTKILVLEKFRSKKSKCVTLEDFLKRASKLKKNREEQKEDGLLLVSLDDLEKMFEIQLNDFLFENNFIGVNFFVCSLFISSLLKETSFSVPESWYAVDYLLKEKETGDPTLLLDGANNCFLLSTLFSKRCERRGMTRNDYVFMGAGLYHRFYNQTGKDFAYYMGDLFEIMSDATGKCVKNMQILD
ncbi:hypothetical protein L6261_01620 [Candidatus Parcubacteria bacterium]|nr:hypothetical protein [Candidatus Parcubacteria bacterium]